MDKRIESAMNELISTEIWSTGLYLSLQVYFEDERLPILSPWLSSQAQNNMNKVYQMINRIRHDGGCVAISEMKRDTHKWTTPLNALNELPEHEQYISCQVSTFLILCRNVNMSFHSFINGLYADRIYVSTVSMELLRILTKENERRLPYLWRYGFKIDILQNLILQDAIWYVFYDITTDGKIYVIMDISVYITLCFTSLFTLIDPLGVMSVLLQMTNGMDTKECRCIALKACTITFIILVLFTLSGRFLFHFFGISTDGFRVMGGIIIFKTRYGMLQAHFTRVELNETERKGYSEDITITSLAIPMLCGPGAASSGITLMEDASEYTFKIILLGVIVLVCVLSFFILCAFTQLLKILEETGDNVMARLMGLILMVVAMECFVSGIHPVLIEILKQAHACS